MLNIAKMVDTTIESVLEKSDIRGCDLYGFLRFSKPIILNGLEEFGFSLKNQKILAPASEIILVWTVEGGEEMRDIYFYWNSTATECSFRIFDVL